MKILLEDIQKKSTLEQLKILKVLCEAIQGNPGFSFVKNGFEKSARTMANTLYRSIKIVLRIKRRLKMLSIV